MNVKIRDWFVLLSGVVSVLLGGFQIAYDIDRFQLRDFIASAILLAGFAWLYYQYKYKKDRTLYDEYYEAELYKLMNYMFASIIFMIMVIILIFEEDKMISVNYIYGAIRFAMGAAILYFSFFIMRDNAHE